ncbi:MAG: synthase subunit delta [Bacteroidota bacterium]|jgi:F-type H+-transporting ATPase subunit delta
MQNPRLAHRYAKSLMDLALERGELEAVHTDMQWLQAVCRSNRDFVALLRSPIIKADAKKKIVAAVTNGHIGALTAAFNNLLVQKGREGFLPEIITHFIASYKEHKRIRTVKLATAAPITEALRQSIIAQVKKEGQYEAVELEETVNPGIIGGFVLQIGDKMVDASVAYDLRTIARQFEKNDFIYNIR